MRELFTFDLPIFRKSTVFVDEWGGLSCSVCSVRSPHVKILAIFLTVDGVATTVPSFIMIWLYTVKCGRGKHQSVRGLVLSEDWYWQSNLVIVCSWIYRINQITHRIYIKTNLLKLNVVRNARRRLRVQLVFGPCSHLAAVFNCCACANRTTAWPPVCIRSIHIFDRRGGGE